MFPELMLVLAATPAVADADAYRRPQLEALLQLGNSRAIDGLEYFDSAGIGLAALRYSHPGGFHAATQFGAGQGNGRLLPDGNTRLLESAFGWSAGLGSARWSLQLQDYRLDAGDQPGQDYQGIAAYLDHGAFSFELAYDREQPYYVAVIDAFVPYDARRVSATWTFQPASHFALSVSLAYKAIDDVDVEYPYAGLRLDWQADDVFLSLAWARAGDSAQDFYGERLSLDTVTLGAGWRFDLSGAVD